jgi:hypothetical protein
MDASAPPGLHLNHFLMTQLVKVEPMYVELLLLTGLVSLGHEKGHHLRAAQDSNQHA